MMPLILVYLRDFVFLYYCKTSQNILRLFNALGQFPFTTSEMDLKYYLQIHNLWVSHKLAKGLRLRILRNKEILIKSEK